MIVAGERRPFGLRDVVLTPRQLALLAYVLIASSFVVDMVTPQALNAEAFYVVPVVLAAFSPNRRLTYRLVILAIVADGVAAFIDAAVDGFRWDVIGVENRFLSLLSLAVVATLTLAVQSASARIGSLSALTRQRRRHAALSHAADHIIAALGGDGLDAAIATEAARVLELSQICWCPAGDSAECWIAEGGATRRISTAALPATLADSRKAPHGDRQPTLANGVLAIPVAEESRLMGLLLAPAERAGTDDGLLLIASSFAGLVVGALQQARLIADLAARNRSLSEKQAVIQGLIDAIAHDLRTPLSALSVTLQQAGDGAYGRLPAEYGGVLRESKTSIDDITRLAETLLLVARLESGARRTHRARIALDAIVRELAAEFGPMASARGVSILVRAERDAVALGARGDVRRAVANLVVNAIAHTPRGGTVTLSAVKSASMIEVRVADDGYGVDENLRGALFERFSQAAQSGTGTGLGLYIVRRVAEEMGGYVRYEPRDPRGSTFTFSLPVAA